MQGTRVYKATNQGELTTHVFWPILLFVLLKVFLRNHLSFLGVNCQHTSKNEGRLLKNEFLLQVISIININLQIPSPRLPKDYIHQSYHQKNTHLG